MKCQTNLDNWWMSKFLYTHSFVVIVIVVQYALYAFLRINENMYFGYMELLDSEPTPGGTVIQNRQFVLHGMVIFLDLVLIL